MLEDQDRRNWERRYGPPPAVFARLVYMHSWLTAHDTNLSGRDLRELNWELLEALAALRAADGERLRQRTEKKPDGPDAPGPRRSRHVAQPTGRRRPRRP